MLFEVYSARIKNKDLWFVRHILSQNDVMGPEGPFEKKKQAEAYCALFENSPFIWHFTNPDDLFVLNVKKEIFDFVDFARQEAERVK